MACTQVFEILEVLEILTIFKIRKVYQISSVSVKQDIFLNHPLHSHFITQVFVVSNVITLLLCSLCWGNKESFISTVLKVNYFVLIVFLESN